VIEKIETNSNDIEIFVISHDNECECEYNDDGNIVYTCMICIERMM
jgi:hypothetical protein